ncbi:hypothetical protein [Calothrix sp. NIES-2100]
MTNTSASLSTSDQWLMRTGNYAKLVYLRSHHQPNWGSIKAVFCLVASST